MVMFEESGSFSVTSTNSYVWAQRWMESEYLINQGGSWLVEGGANIPCKIDKIKCEEIGKFG